MSISVRSVRDWNFLLVFRSQGFPDCFKFHGSVLDKHRQIGNAVAPPMGKAIGIEIRKCVAQVEREAKIQQEQSSTYVAACTKHKSWKVSRYYSLVFRYIGIPTQSTQLTTDGTCWSRQIYDTISRWIKKGSGQVLANLISIIRWMMSLAHST